MGTCFSLSCSHSESAPPPATAKVVSISGALREYNVPVFVYQVLETEKACSSSSSSSSSNYFICNSDRLYYDDFVPALDLNDELQADQIYFVLPKSKLQHRLAASDMAALAVKASVALENASKKDSHRRKKARISPVMLLNHQNASASDFQADMKIDKYNPSSESPKLKTHQKTGSSAPVKRLHRYTSRRAKMAVRSFRLGLTTIYEGTVHL